MYISYLYSALREMLIGVTSSWYNVPPATTSKSSSKQKAGDSPATTVPNANGTVHPEVGVQFGVDSTPLNFDTFVPSHDPSLATATAAVAAGPLLSTTTEPGVSVAGTDSATAMVNQDEAFSRAMTAMYWSGYWTAVYHVRSLTVSACVHTCSNAESSVVGTSLLSKLAGK